MLNGLPPSRASEKAAVLVGVNKYQKPGFANLTYAEADVDQVVAGLRKLGFRVTLLKGSDSGTSQATRQNVVVALQKLVAPLGKDDLALVMFSGHGQQFEVARLDGSRREDSFFCPVDGVSNDASTLVSLSL